MSSLLQLYISYSQSFSRARSFTLAKILLNHHWQLLGFQAASLLGVETQNSGEASLRYVRRNAALPTGVILNPP